ncbi:hypothetical protein AQJ91_09135 [Streptomyces dysideae]|uniref:Uncharacterized protein n=1 Tax=Streptomyces dysideae TaxID=909626 RepID=A0A117S1P4_9ACTN|nr:hypothetical protein AQJ91_09135 [Streptomyces dysideae]
MILGSSRSRYSVSVRESPPGRVRGGLRRGPEPRPQNHGQRIGLRRRTRTVGTVTEPTATATDEADVCRVLAEAFGIDAPKVLTLLR